MPQEEEEILADRWVLVEKIDEGAMGEIFSARHALLGHAVAVKVLIPTVSRDKAAIERFLREARIAAKLQHRNVVRVEDFGVAADGRPFLVMELLRGESLARRMAREPAMAHREALDIVRQIAAAVDTAHAAGIVHRDLKPENVFLASEGVAVVVKVLDFGVAKFTDLLANGAHATASNTLVGTPRYMSPEQARSLRELDGRSDLWSLAMIAYEMLTGEHPFEGEAIAELLVAILTHRIPPPTALRPALPSALDAWTTRALARSRYERFSTGRELADALADALDGRLDLPWATDVRPPPSREETPRRGTVRIKRPVARPDADDTLTPSEPTPREATAPVTLSKPPEGARSRDASGAARHASHPSLSARASWWIAVATALAAALGLMIAIRAANAPRNTGRPATLHPPSAAREVAREPERAPLPEFAAPLTQSAALIAESPQDAAPVTVRDSQRHRATSPRPDRRHEVSAPPTPRGQIPNQQGGRLYDPTGI